MVMNKKLILFLLISSLAAHAASIDSLVIPAGGFGTRMLPFTWAFPKEIMPLMNKPAVQETVEEGLRSGLTKFYMITKRQKSGIEDHFDVSPELEGLLQKAGKSGLVADLKDIRDKAQFIYVRQPVQGGTGHAVAMLKNIIQDDYFCVGWPDIVILGEPNLYRSMIELSQKYGASVIAVEEIPMDQVSNYGVVVIGNELEHGVWPVLNLIEKPKPSESPSNLVNGGRFVLSKKIFASLDVIPVAANGELQLPDAILDMMHKGERVIAYKVKGTLHDIGRPMPWLETNILYALQHPDFKNDTARMLKEIIKRLD